MIPKKLHYCWLSGDIKPPDTIKCMRSWNEILPDYEIILWDTKKFDIESVPFVAQAYRAGKWAFAADYIRLYALFTEGGIYLDTDVFVQKKFDDFLQHDFFTGIEYHERIFKEQHALDYLYSDGTLKNVSTTQPFSKGIGIQAAIMGGVAGHPYLFDAMNWYQDKDFNQFFNILAPSVYAHIALEYGFRYKDEQQNLAEEMLILPSSVFAGTLGAACKDSYAIHCCQNSWRNKGLKKYFNNNFIRALLGKKRIPTVDDLLYGII